MRNVPTVRINQILLTLVLLAGSIYIASTPDASVVQWYNNDDGFFYFKTAQNIVAGKGITFDGINPTNGFHPLWMVICVGVFALVKGSLIAPLRVIILIFGVFYTASGLLLFSGLRRKFPDWMSFCLTLGLLTSWFVYTYTYSGGLESGLASMMMIWLWQAATRWKADPDRMNSGLVKIGLLGAVTVLSRLDTIFLVGFMGIWLAIENHKTRAWLFADLIIPLLLSTSAVIIRSGFAVFHFYHLVLLLTFVLVLVAIPGFYLLGFYSHPARWLQNQSRLVRSLVLWAVSVVILWAGVSLAYRFNLVETFSGSILLVLSIVWLGYSVLLRGWFLGRSEREISSIPVAWKELFVWLAKPAAYFIPVVAFLAGYSLINLIVFHTPMPVSGQIKQWWGSLGQTTYGSALQTWKDLQEYLLSGDSVFGYLMNLPGIQQIAAIGKKWNGEAAVWVILAMVGMWIWYRQRKENSDGWADDLAVLPLLAATIFRLDYFYISGYVHMRSWYWTVETFFVFLLLVSLLHTFRFGFSPSKLRQVAASVLMILWAGLLLASWVGNILRVYPVNESARSNRDYLIVPEMVRSATPGDAVIGTPGGGSLSYFIQDRMIVNLDGLMNSKEYFDALQQMNTHSQMQDSQVTYIFGNENTLFKSSPYARIFADCLTQVQQIYGKTLFRYECNQTP